MKLADILPPSDLPTAGARIPGFAIRVTLALAGSLLSLADYGVSGWVAVGIVLGVGAALAPQHMLGWLLILFLALGQLAHHSDLSWRLLLLLAGVHLLHVLSMLTLELPWRSWIQPAVFMAPLRRFVAIQVPTQLLAVAALLLLAPSHSGHRPLTVAGFAVIGGLALAGLALLLLGPRPNEG
jgi:hypothetical protein